MTPARWVQLGVLAVLIAGIIWVARNTYWDYQTVDKPLQGDALINRFYAFEHLARRLGVRSNQISTLRTLPPTGGVLVIDDLHDPQMHTRLGELQDWVQRGGRLLISRDLLLATPALQSWSGVSMGLRDSVDEDSARPPPAHGRGADDCAPVIERIDGIDSGNRYRACLDAWEFSLASRRTPQWSLSNEQGMQMLRVGVGKGSLAVIVCECMMGNRSLLREDHAQILYAAVPLTAGDAVAILNPTDAEGMLSLLWRIAPAAILCAVAAVFLVLWRQWPRFGPIAPVAPPLRRSLAEQIRAKARFSSRTRNLGSLRRAARTSLDGVAARRLPAYGRLTGDARIEALAVKTGIGAAAIRAAVADEFQGGVEAELAAVALLESARRTLDVNPFLSQGTRA